jgi:hypothetical protein
MFNQTKIALAIAIVLGTASGAFAATKHHNHKGPTAQTPVSAYGAYGSVDANTGRVIESGAMAIQDRDWSDQVGGKR